MKILFMGTPDFALPTLKALHASGEDMVGVVTQPDKPRGRGHIMTPPPIKVYAEQAGIPVFQPATLKNGAFDEQLKALDPDLIVVVAYGKMLPLSVLDYPKYGCINVHGSLLPLLRGAAPMQRAIIDGHKVTGITTMYMGEGIDTGDMLLKREIPIEDDDNFETIHDKLAELGASTMIDTLKSLKAGTLVRIPQEHEKATYAAKIEKADCLLNFTLSARDLHNLIRGLSPFPLSFTHTPDGKMLKVVAAKVCKTEGQLAPYGTVLSVDDGIEVACGKGSLLLLRVTPEGKGQMPAADFVRGRKVTVGDVLT